ncbi:hypothetical protein PAXRUDRAFT_166469 [Paxillus rubicundulus Ve08.2h10]|uniref:Uncharacterized protein n=1 Tax=Paxillus rubicundulus Ve08.2h10 TaxID=930991 RepID=A0A0D0CQB6_9AGAM|nr:hypothetical protein PAXRUDRAFT_166469 [Paxillus rubicundulus Ve08.2h10]
MVHCSSDHPNIKIGVKKIKYALNSFSDLTFLIHTGIKVGDPPPLKFLVFFNNIADTISAACFIHQRLPCELRDKIMWFNANMSAEYKQTELDNLISGETWGLFTTTSFGMVSTVVHHHLQGMVMLDISLVIQWRATCKVAALWQHFGCAVRDQALTGTALLFAEKEYFNDEKAVKSS